MKQLVNLANGLTLSRFVLAPVMLVLLMYWQGPDPLQPLRDLLEQDGGGASISVALFVIMIVAMLTDLFDGMAARAYGEVTNFGKIMDPVADSTFFMTLFFGLSASPRFGAALPIWMPILILYREVGIHVLRRYAALRGIVLAARWSGKAKMATQCVAMTLLLGAVMAADLDWLDLKEESLRTFAFACGLVTVVVNLLSLADYLRDAPHLFREGEKS